MSETNLRLIRDLPLNEIIDNYRVKTEAEFIEDFGKNWTNSSDTENPRTRCNFVISIKGNTITNEFMGKFLGERLNNKNIFYTISKKCDSVDPNNDRLYVDTRNDEMWCLSADMLIEVNDTKSYNRDICKDKNVDKCLFKIIP